MDVVLHTSMSLILPTLPSSCSDGRDFPFKEALWMVESCLVSPSYPYGRDVSS